MLVKVKASQASPLSISRLGLIAEHGYWVKPAAAHRTKDVTRDRGSTGWEQAPDGGSHDTYGEPQGWDVAEGGPQHRQASAGESRGSAASTPVGHHPSMSYRNRTHGNSRQLPGTGPPSPDGAQPTDGAREVGRGSGWSKRSHNADLSWRNEVLAILQNFTHRTPGSFLELKDRFVTEEGTTRFHVWAMSIEVMVSLVMKEWIPHVNPFLRSDQPPIKLHHRWRFMRANDSAAHALGQERSAEHAHENVTWEVCAWRMPTPPHAVRSPSQELACIDRTPRIGRRIESVRFASKRFHRQAVFCSGVRGDQGHA